MAREIRIRSVVKRRICDDVVRFESRLLIVNIGIAEPDIAIDSMNEKIHPAETVSKIFGFLTEETKSVAMFGKHIGLNKHTAGAAARVEDGAICWLQHGDQGLNNTDGCEILTPPLAFGVGKLADEILIDTPNKVLAAVILTEHVAREGINKAPKMFRGEIRARVNARKQSSELIWIRVFEKLQNIVQIGLDVVALGVGNDAIPSGVLGNNESSTRAVFVRVVQNGIEIFDANVVRCPFFTNAI